VVAEDEDVLLLVEFLVGATGDFVHGDEGCAFDVCGGELPRLADVEQERGWGGGEKVFGLVYGDFEVH
jgi:hypothetical protein